jgi:large subunit ribosomal protein L19
MYDKIIFGVLRTVRWIIELPRTSRRRGGITMDIIKALEQEYAKKDVPQFNVGDTVKVHIKIKEGTRERIQLFEGFVLKRQNGGLSETFTVRRIASGIGVEKTFPLHSPKIEKIEVTRRGDVRRSKLFYMRERTGKAAKIKIKKD